MVLKHSLKILLVEDNDDDAHSVRRHLDRSAPHDLELTRVETLSEARQVLAGHPPFQVVLLDLNLPDSEGIDTLRSLLEEAPREVAVVVLTGNDDEKLGLEAISCGAEDYLYKGLREPGLLMRVVRYACERKAGETRLRESEGRLRSLVENTPGAVYRSTLRRPREFEFLSEAVRDLTGYGAEAFLPGGHLTLSEIIHGEDRKRVTDTLASRLANGKDFEIEYRIIHRDGSARWIYESGRLLAPVRAGGVGTLDGFLFDITERKHAQQNLLNAKRAAEASSRAKSVFIARMSHEVRTPLNVVLGFAQLHLDDPDLAPAASHSIRAIHESGQDLLGLVNEILEMARLNDQSVELEIGPCQLKPFFRELESEFRARAEAKGLEFSMELAKNLPAVLGLDRMRLRRALGNLLDNAVKFTECGHVACRVSGERLGGETWSVKIEVEDSGIGMDAPDGGHGLFQPFRQDAPELMCEGSTGLGLSLSAGYVDLMGGEITMESRSGKGSVFRVLLDLAEAEEPSEPETTPVAASQTKRSAEPHPALDGSPPPSEKTVTPTSSRLPGPLVQRLCDAAVACDRRRLGELSDEAARHDSDLAETIRDLARHFRYDQLREALEA